MRLGTIAQKLVAVVKQYDKSRPVTAGLAGVAMSNQTAYPSSLDIAGYNYTENRYLSDHKKYPGRVIYGSENRHDLVAWNAVLDNEHIFGQFLWTGIDYLGESGKWPSRGFYSGLLDFAGNIKPRGYFRQSLWSEEPMAYLGTYPIDKDDQYTPEDVLSQTEEPDGTMKLSMDAWPIWDYKKGQNIRIVCYTNTAKAQLILNGKKIGAEKPYDTTTGIIYWDIPFTAGKLEVAGLDKSGNEIIRYKIETPRQAHAIRVSSYEDIISAQNGISQIRLQITDRNGIPVNRADNEIVCEVTGAGELLGLEAGNNTDMSDYTDYRQKTYRGKLTAYIRATGRTENITVTFSAKGLTPAGIRIRVIK